MKWIKKGKIFSVKNNFGWMNTHSQIPTILLLDDRMRVYFDPEYFKVSRATVP